MWGCLGGLFGLALLEWLHFASVEDCIFALQLLPSFRGQVDLKICGLRHVEVALFFSILFQRVFYSFRKEIVGSTSFAQLPHASDGVS